MEIFQLIYKDCIITTIYDYIKMIFSEILKEYNNTQFEKFSFFLNKVLKFSIFCGKVMLHFNDLSQFR